jgi:hypothetical protein
LKVHGLAVVQEYATAVEQYPRGKTPGMLATQFLQQVLSSQNSRFAGNPFFWQVIF